MDPRLGTITSGPGETVFAIGFNGKPKIVWKTLNFRTPKKTEKINQTIRLGPFLGNNQK